MDQTLGLTATAAAVVVRENGFDVHPFHPVSEGARWDIVLDRGPESIGEEFFRNFAIKELSQVIVQ